jgi:hypothetical protein
MPNDSYWPGGRAGQVHGRLLLGDVEEILHPLAPKALSFTASGDLRDEVYKMDTKG